LLCRGSPFLNPTTLKGINYIRRLGENAVKEKKNQRSDTAGDHRAFARGEGEKFSNRARRRKYRRKRSKKDRQGGMKKAAVLRNRQIGASLTERGARGKGGGRCTILHTTSSKRGLTASEECKKKGTRSGRKKSGGNYKKAVSRTKRHVLAGGYGKKREKEGTKLERDNLSPAGNVNCRRKKRSGVTKLKNDHVIHEVKVAEWS